MKSYKEYEKKYIGMSDIANLILAGSSDNGLKLAVLHFGMICGKLSIGYTGVSC